MRGLVPCGGYQPSVSTDGSKARRCPRRMTGTLGDRASIAGTPARVRTVRHARQRSLTKSVVPRACGLRKDHTCQSTCGPQTWTHSVTVSNVPPETERWYRGAPPPRSFLAAPPVWPPHGTRPRVGRQPVL